MLVSNFVSKLGAAHSSHTPSPKRFGRKVTFPDVVPETESVTVKVLVVEFATVYHPSVPSPLVKSVIIVSPLDNPSPLDVIVTVVPYLA